MLDYIILKNDKNNYEAIETGFSYFALIYGPLWVAFHSLWAHFAIGVFSLFCIIGILVNFELQSFIMFTIFLFNLFWGFFGRDLLVYKFLENEFYPVKLIGASSRKNAMIKYLSELSK